MITVVNVKDKPEYHGWSVYIGRANGHMGLGQSPLASPFPLPQYTREESIRLYEERARKLIAEAEVAMPLRGPGVEFKRELIRLNRLLKQHGKLELWCWCAPLACHGDVIKKILYEWNAISE